MTSLLVVWSPPAQAEPSTDCPDAPPRAAETELAASYLAMTCEVEVEIAAEGTEFGGVFAQPDGEMVLRVGAEPYRARDDSGEWAPIDTDLVVTSAGRLAPVNAVNDVSLSGGGDHVFATLSQDGKSLSLEWPEALPSPVVSGNEAAYPDVFPGVDLVVRALPEGFSHDIVVHTAEAAHDPRLVELQLGLNAAGLTASVLENGGVEVADSASNEVFSTAPPPLMWDSPSTTARSSGDDPVSPQVASVEVEVSDGALLLTPDRELLTGKDTRFPVVIDPMWSGKKRDGEWGSAWSNFPTQLSWKGSEPKQTNASARGDAGAGQTCDTVSGLNCVSAAYKVRSFFRMNTEPVTRNSNRQVISASFKILQKHSASCSAGKARLWRTAQITASHSWNNQPTWLGDYVDSAAAANNGGSCGGNKYAQFNVTSIVKKVADGQGYSVTFGLRAVNESPSPALAQWRRYDSSTAVLEISYNSYPQVPTNVDTHGKGCATSADDAVTFTTGSVKVTGIPRDPDGKVYPQFQVHDQAGSSDVRTYKPSAQATTGKSFTWTVNPPLPDGDYRWRMRSVDNYAKSDNANSPYTGYCYFSVDTEPPEQPEAVLLTDDPMLGDQVTFGLSGPLDTAEFVFRLNGESDETVTAVEGGATVTLLPSVDNVDHVLQVWARDASGNLSDRYDLAFTTRLPGEISWWPLAGDGMDFGPGGNDVTVPETAEWVEDSFGVDSSAMQLDGDRCAASTEPVLNTAQSYTLSSWVKLDSKQADQTVVSQSGEHQTAFYLQYRHETDTWAVGVSEADVPNPVGRAGAVADIAVPVGEWVHLTGVIDTARGQIQIYVDGILRGQSAMSFVPWESQGPLNIGCSANRDGTWNPVHGAVHDVRVFDGVVTAEQAGAIGATIESHWALDATGNDSFGGNDLTFHGEHDWVENRDDRPESAYGLNLEGEGYAQGDETSVRGDESFTVMAWVKLDSKAFQSFVGQSGYHRSSFKLQYHDGTDQFTFSMSRTDAETTGWDHARSETTPQLGVWYHLTGVYDAAANRMHLYVNGVLEASTSGPPAAWHDESGIVLIGASGATSGARNQFADAVIDDVSIYSGILDERRIALDACGPELCNI